MVIKVVGLGGIGTCLLQILDKFLEHAVSLKDTIKVFLIDGDMYIEKNSARQFFASLGNKAHVCAESFNERSRRVVYEGIAEYVTSDNMYEFIREGDVVFLCVDNHATRKLVSDRAEELADVVVISGGNELVDGNVQIFTRKDSCNITLPLTNEFHPEIFHPQDLHPEDAGCEEAVEESPQIIITNNAVASAMLNAFYAHLQGLLHYDEVYVDILTNNSRQVVRR